MTKEELLESYLTNLRNKLNSIDFNAANMETAISEASVIKARMWNRLNAYFEEHFVDDLSDEQIDDYFKAIAKGTEEIIKSLPVDINRYLN